MSANVEDFLIVWHFYSDLNELINKERNLGLTKPSLHSLFFHLKKWGIPLASTAMLSVIFTLFFSFPLYFAAFWVVYVILYIMSEFLLSYRLKLARVLTWYTMILLFFLLGGFNINYQQVATERLTQAHILLRAGSGGIDTEKAMVQWNSVLDPNLMKANIGEALGSGKLNESREAENIR